MGAGDAAVEPGLDFYQHNRLLKDNNQAPSYRVCTAMYPRTRVLETPASPGAGQALLLVQSAANSDDPPV